jgi:SOS response regulatory protein OraA/RecX
MGELRYFPGSEPRGPESQPDSGPAEPEWRVPVIETTDGPTDPTHSSDRAARTAERVSLRTVARHDVSEAELRQKLVARGLEHEDVEAELDRMRRTGLVDDAALAERLVRTLRERKGLADAALRPALRARLLPPDVIDAALAEAAEDRESVEERLDELAHDRAERLTTLPPDVAERRLIGFLQRKGYSGSAVRVAAEAALADAWRHRNG